MNAAELFAKAVELRESENLLDIAIVITTGRKSELLWLSKGEVKRRAKKLLRKGGTCECFIKIRPSGNCKWSASAEALDGVDPKRASHILWSYGSAHHRWEMKLN